MAVTIDQGPMDAPDRIGPGMISLQNSSTKTIANPRSSKDYSEQRTKKEHLQHIFKAFTTKKGLIGDYDYGKNSLSQAVNMS